MLELVPHDASAAITIRNLDELIQRGDKLLNDTDVKVPIRPSELFNMGAQFLGVNQGLDRKRAAAILLMPPEKKEDVQSLRWLETSLVPVLPFTDADKMAGNFGIAKGDFTPKSIHRTGRKDIVNNHAMRLKDHIALCGAERTLKSLQDMKPLAAEFELSQRKLFDDGDVLIHLGKHLWSLDDAGLAKELAGKIRAGDDPKEKEFAELLRAGIRDVNNALIGIRLKDGIDGHFLATVPKASNAAKLLAIVRQQQKSSTLHALPEGNVLFAQAATGDGSPEKLLAKAIFNFLLEDILIQGKLVANVDRLQYLGVFHEVWSRLEGHRVAVYQNGNETKEGLFTAIAILDTSDAAGFVREMRTLAKMAVADSLDWSKKDVQEEIDIPRLVKSLGSKVFQARQSANTKLLLIGEPALPVLQKAIDSKELDLETLRRCQTLRQQISDVAAARRKELLRESSAPLFVRPKLTFIANAEKRLGQNVDVVKVSILANEKAGQKQAVEYTQMLGADWDKLRLAVVGKQIVVMLGSNVELFDQALRNVQKNDAGLAGTKRLADFYSQASKERLFELHVSTDGIMRLTTQQAALDTKAQLTSFALALGATSVQLDARFPTGEVRAIARKAQEAIK
jgi:hypothetical protein